MLVAAVHYAGLSSCVLTAVRETDGQQTQLTFSMLCSALAYPSHTPDLVYLHKILIMYVFITWLKEHAKYSLGNQGVIKQGKY